MSTYLWKYYLEDDVDNFRLLLANANYTWSGHGKPHLSTTSGGTTIGSPGKGLATSPTLHNKSRKSSGLGAGLPGNKGQRPFSNITLTRADINSKDAHGVTLLHHIASSSAESAPSYALALLNVPLLDIYIQDLESGWTSLHRALYFGNVTIARALLDRDIQDTIGYNSTSGNHGSGGLIKIKDRESNSPFDVFGATITIRMLRHGTNVPTLPSGLDDEEDELAHGDSGDIDDDGSGSKVLFPRISINGDELFMFGSNKNLTLGFGDEDDRQYPERITLKRPDHLLRRLQGEHQARSPSFRSKAGSPRHEQSDFMGHCPLPALVEYQPIIIQDVQLSKLHTAILTTDPEANLYVCGFGPGGRLGTGDETTRFTFTCIYGGGLMGKRVISIGMGQNHTVAISSLGEVFTWGSNAFGQLGYSVPSSNVKDEEPLQLLPRQIFGPLKREIIIGTAASRTHTVVHTSTSLYTFGKNDGQLGLVDSDARSLEIQVTPRKVAASLFSSSIGMVAAIDKATVCLLENHEVWIFANYGYTRMAFPLDGFSHYFLRSSYSTTRYDSTPNHISKISAGGDTICAMARMGDVFTITVSQKSELAAVTTSTTNPAKIRGALSPPQRVWSLKKIHMAVRDVDVGQDGSVIICTESGSVWKRVRRAKIKETASPADIAEYKPRDYKFSRVPGLTRVTAVRSNTFGAFAAVRRDCDVLRTQVEVASYTLWKDLFSLLSFHTLSRQEDSDTEDPAPRFWTPRVSDSPATIRHAVLTSPDVEETLAGIFTANHGSESSNGGLRLGTTTSKVLIPCHEFMLAGRSKVLRHALSEFRQSYFFGIPEVLTVEYGKDGDVLVLFQGIDFLTIINLVLYIYTDSLIDVWHHTRHSPQLAFRYRQVRTELMKFAGHLGLRCLEQAARLMAEPSKTLHHDMERAILDSEFFETGDVNVELNGSTVKVHSALMCQRCPFFEGLFHGRAAGRWLTPRRELLEEPQEAIKVDLQHIDVAVFELVLRYIYADTGEELFDAVVSTDYDAFLNLIMDVMSVANELMLDRLAQICQNILGRFVNTRNICQLLNDVAPCSVTEFKDAALEYICLNLEGMLENNFLGELDDDLMLELDQVVRENQLACLPIAKSGRAEAKLHKQYPELAALIERSKRAKVDSMALHSRLHEDEMKSINASRTRAGNPGPGETPSSTHYSRHGSSKERSTNPTSPSLKAKLSTNDLMFHMDDEIETTPFKGAWLEQNSSGSKGKEREEYDELRPRTPLSSLSREEVWFHSNGKESSHVPANLATDFLPSHTIPSPAGVNIGQEHLERAGISDKRPIIDTAPWGSSALTSPKLDMKEILSQASGHRTSNLASALSRHVTNEETSKLPPAAKMSQKERKKQLLQQQLFQGSMSPSPEIAPTQQSPRLGKAASPWQTASIGPRVSLKDVLGTSIDTSATPTVDNGRTTQKPPLTMRQTVSGKAEATRKSSLPAIPSSLAIQKRSISSPVVPFPSLSTAPRPFQTPQQPHPTSDTPSSSSIAIRSIRHNPRPVEASLQLSMADILSQQQTEKDIVREATAKRSLQEIQEEQAFNEWWDQESKKVMEEEEAAARLPSDSVRGGRGGTGGRGKSRSRSSRGRGRGRGRGQGPEDVLRGRGGARGGGGGSQQPVE